MILIRPGKNRGQTKLGWLDARHTFSFGRYHDEAHMGFRALRVINQDRIAGGGGFPMHPHADMEIITCILEGAIAHEDSLGHRSVLNSGGVQIISAGTGVTHAEFNDSETDPLHLLQMWVEPDNRGLSPGYAEKSFRAMLADRQWHLVGSKDGRDGSLRIHQDVSLSMAKLQAGDDLDCKLERDRHAWVHLAAGEILMNDEKLTAGDGAAISGESGLRIKAGAASDLVMFDLA